MPPGGRYNTSLPLLGRATAAADLDSSAYDDDDFDEAAVPLISMASHDAHDDLMDRKSPVVTPTRVQDEDGDGWLQPGVAMVEDNDLDGLSLYEKKCVLINREIDSMGMGRYQWYIWGLCGFGYMLDLLWAQAFGLALSPLQQEMGFGNGQSGNISTSFNVGLTAGAFIWGVLSDIVGK